MGKDGTYKTVNAVTEGLYKEKGSKFIGLVYPLTSDSLVKEIIEPLRKEHPNARHFCYAYRLGFKGEKYRANDDGEPGGTAGKPMLNQLLSFEVTNILVVVIRYFGGTKLGVSGLITAYKQAAYEALNIAEVVEYEICDTFEIELDYDHLGEVNRILKEQQLEPVEKKFDLRCFYLIHVPIAKSRTFSELFTLIKKVSVKRQEQVI